MRISLGYLSLPCLTASRRAVVSSDKNAFQLQTFDNIFPLKSERGSNITVTLQSLFTSSEDAVNTEMLDAKPEETSTGELTGTAISHLNWSTSSPAMLFFTFSHWGVNFFITGENNINMTVYIGDEECLQANIIIQGTNGCVLVVVFGDHLSFHAALRFWTDSPCVHKDKYQNVIEKLLWNSVSTFMLPRGQTLSILKTTCVSQFHSQARLPPLHKRYLLT